MRTTLKLDDAVFHAYKQRAATRGTTFAHEVEEALRADLHTRDETAAHEPFRTPVFAGDDTPALVDINDNRALGELMDDEDRAAEHR